MLLGFSRRNVVRQSQHHCRRAPKRRRLFFDCLEDRRLLSGGSLTTPGTSVTIDNSGSLLYDSPRAVAMDSAGDAVVAWADQQSSGNWNLMFERYTNSSGTLTPQGAVTQASNVTTGPWEDGTSGAGSIMVARAPTTGDFVVIWATGTNATKRNTWGTEATHAQLYSSAGTPIGSAFLLSGNNMPKSVAINDTGFDVLYAALPKSGSGYTLKVQRYSYTPSSDAAVGTAISVVTPGWDDDGNGSASLGIDGSGNFVVGWKDWINNNITNLQVVDVELFTSAGAGQGVIQASDNAGPNASVAYYDVAMDSTGNFVVDWAYYAGNGGPGSLEARQFTTGGLPVQAESSPIVVAAADNFGPDGIAELPDGNSNGDGAFDVTWNNATATGIDAATYNASGTQTQFLNVSTSGTESSAAVDGNSDLFVVYNASGVHGQFYLDPPAPAPASASTALSTTGTTSPSASTSAAADAVFAAYAYPEEDDTLS